MVERYRAPEDTEVRNLCEKWGYGAVMSSASRQWIEIDPVGALTVGGCYLRGKVQDTRPPITDEGIERAARALCKSGKYETGEGTCAVLCMEFLGSPRKSGCAHAMRVHGKTARAAITAYLGGNDA